MADYSQEPLGHTPSTGDWKPTGDLLRVEAKVDHIIQVVQRIEKLLQNGDTKQPTF